MDNFNGEFDRSSLAVRDIAGDIAEKLAALNLQDGRNGPVKWMPTVRSGVGSVSGIFEREEDARNAADALAAMRIADRNDIELSSLDNGEDWALYTGIDIPVTKVDQAMLARYENNQNPGTRPQSPSPL